MAGEKFDIKITAIDIIVCIIAASVGGFLTLDAGWKVALSSAILWGFFGLVAVRYIKEVVIRDKERDKFLERVDTNIDKRMEKVSQYVALHTKNGSFEGITRPLGDPSFGKVKWVIAKFISRKISEDFGPPGAINEVIMKDINAQEYSKFTKDLYPESESSIFLTSIFTPKEWFRALLSDEEYNLVREGGTLPREDFPFHMQALLDCPVERKRLLILVDEKWDECFSDSSEAKKLLKEFKRINGTEIELRFVKESILKKKIPQLRIFPFQTTDIAIYDRKVLVEWKRKDGEIGDMHLTFQLSERLLDLFDFKSISFYKKI